jgi:acyl-coenzyme A thioesterase PaaI-like protein
MGIAFLSTLHGRQSAATVELNMNFLRPVWRGRLVAVARVVQRDAGLASSIARSQTRQGG